MNSHNLPNYIKTKSKNKSSVKIQSILVEKFYNQSRSSPGKIKKIKSGLFRSKLNKSLVDSMFASPTLNKKGTNKFVPKECKIQCSDFNSSDLPSEEEEEEMGKGLKDIGKELKQRLIGMEAGIIDKNYNKNSSKKLRYRSSESLTIIKKLMNSKIKKEIKESPMILIN